MRAKRAERKNGVRRIKQPASVLGVSSQAVEMIALAQHGSKISKTKLNPSLPLHNHAGVVRDHTIFSSEIDADSAYVLPIAV